jgi:hypothetical protein
MLEHREEASSDGSRGVGRGDEREMQYNGSASLVGGPMNTAQEHEAGLVAFVVRAKRERIETFLANKKNRHKVVDDLWHFREWDPHAVVQLAPSRHTAEAVVAELKRRGAGEDVYLVSATSELDRRVMLLADALRAVVGSSSGTVVSCVPGRLAYFEGEGPGDRCILQR